METSVIYSRVSTNYQDNQSQIDDLLRYSKEKNFNNVEIFEEKISGYSKKQKRVELDKCISFIKKNKIDNLLIYEVSRLGRLTKDVLETINELNELKINLHIKDKGLKTLNDDKSVNDMTNLVLTILSGISESEGKQIKNRSKRGLLFSSKMGVIGGIPPYGYIKDENRKLKVCPIESKIVKDIFDLSLKGYGSRKISDYLNENKIPTKSQNYYDSEKVIRGQKVKDMKWNYSLIYSILTNKTYIGKREFSKELLDFEELRIIDNNTFYNVEKSLKNNESKKGIHTKHFYFFENVKLICGICGKNYIPHKKLDNSRNTYLCNSKRVKNDCGNYGIGIDKLVNSVWYHLVKSEYIKRLIEKSQQTDEIKNKIIEVNNDIELIKKELSKNENVLSRLNDIYLMGGKTKEEYQRDLKRYNIDRTKILEKLTSFENQKIQLNEMLENQQNYKLQIRQIKGDKFVLKEYIEKLVKEIVIYPIKNDTPILSTKSNDNHLYIELFLLPIIEPLKYIISQRTNKVLRLSVKGINFDKTNYTIKLNQRIISDFTDNIRFQTEKM